MTLHHTLLARLCRDAGFDIDLDMRALATACGIAEMTAFLDAAYALACAQLRAAWASDAVDCLHHIIRDIELGELDVEGGHLGASVAARQTAHELIKRRTAEFHAACLNLQRDGEKGFLVLAEPTPAASR
ncbi:hypothetical protein [Longispora albida]|uniref:hypothetical protein n=1 Tax=Longispora albida TaxID=203523 RepID=UPI00036FAB5B|nr:hypothetical protein [Longispora albida]